MPSLKRGLELLAQRRQFPRLHQFGTRTINELREHGLNKEATEIEAWFKSVLPQMPSFDSQAKKPTLPTHCPSCGAPLRPDEVNGWTMSPVNAVTAEVPSVTTINIESSFLFLLSFILRLHRLIHQPASNMSITFSEEYISQKLHEALATAGPSSDGFSEITLNEEKQLKCAAVLVPLVWQDNEWHLLYTRRTDKVESHKGQVSFPGGACTMTKQLPNKRHYVRQRKKLVFTQTM